jgi:hypothetical protein
VAQATNILHQQINLNHPVGADDVEGEAENPQMARFRELQMRLDEITAEAPVTAETIRGDLGINN